MKSAIFFRALRSALLLLLAATIAAPAAAQNQGAQEAGSTGGSSLGSTTVGDLNIVPTGKTLHIVDKNGVGMSKMKFKKKITSVKGVANEHIKLVYVTTSEGLFVVNVTDPAKPIIIGFFPIPSGTVIFSSTLNTDSSGNIFNNCATGFGVARFNVTQPTNIVELNFLPLPYPAYAQGICTINFEHCVTACGSSLFGVNTGLQVAPPIDFITTGTSNATGIACHNDLVCVADGYFGGLKTYEIVYDDNNILTATLYRKPTGLKLLSTLPMPGTGLKLEFADPPPGLRVLVPSHVRLGTAPASPTPTPIVRVLVAANEGGVHLVNVTDPAHPVLEKTIKTPGPAINVSATTSTAVISDSSTGALIYDLSDPLNPTLKQTVPGTSASDALAIGTTLYQANLNNGGLSVFSTASPGDPVFLNQVRIGDSFSALQPLDSATFLACSISGLSIFDAANPTTPTLQGSFHFSFTHGMALNGHYVMLAGGGFPDDLAIVDIANRAAPVKVKTFKIPVPNSLARDVAVSGNYAYVAAAAGTAVFKLDDPTSPTFVTLINPPDQGAFSGYMLGVAAQGSVLAMADSGNGFHLYDVTNPAAPVNLYSDSTVVANSVSLSLDGKTLYVSAVLPATGDGRLMVFDIANPQNPKRIALADMPDFPQHSRLIGEKIYVATGEGGLSIIKLINAAGDWLGYD